MRDLIAAATQEFEQLTGRRVDSVTAAERDADGLRICVEVVELERIPASTNLMGSYQLLVDDDGSVVEFARTRRYHRNQADDDE